MENGNEKLLKRATGLLILEVVSSNPNGDPDNESDPRMRLGGCGEISPVSFKRKLRDLVEQKEGPVWRAVADSFEPRLKDEEFDILEKRGRDRTKILGEVADGTFTRRYWDARLFGNTFLEKHAESPIRTGVVQFGMGLSVAPVEVERLTLTNKAGVEAELDRGMAPLGYRVVQHGVYTMPFFVNPTAALKSGCERRDLEVMLKLIPHAYSHTASFVRPDVRVRHAWYVAHKSALGSCPDWVLIEALMPKKRSAPEEASKSWAEYDVPAGLPPDIQTRVGSCRDLTEE